MSDKNEAQPNRALAASLIEVYGDINNRELGFLIDERYEVGPLPIDRPNKIISDSLIPMHLVKYSYIITESCLIYSSPGLDVLYSPYPGYSIASTCISILCPKRYSRSNANPISSAFP